MREDRTTELVGDCASCVGLCCVALSLVAGADFALDKPDGLPCPNLDEGHHCGIHTELRQRGFAGCIAYDCFGAGQKVTQETFGGGDWRATPEISGPMFATYRTMRQLHEALWVLGAALALPAAASVHADLQAAFDEIEAITHHDAAAIIAVDVSPLRGRVGELVQKASRLARSAIAPFGEDLGGADLFGKDLRRRNLRGADLRGAILIGANLHRADLTAASLLGADLRGADLGGADLAGALFLAQGQVESALGDRATRLPPGVVVPANW